ncbi:MAG: hypothetical protein OXF73_02140 [Gammaproteobacteria bacterium]|nr:hypothetical protein [Gammaproteobacteria bacterium]
MNKNTDKITGILDQIRILKAKHAELAAATGEDFNIFSILHTPYKASGSTNSHTNFGGVVKPSWVASSAG